MIEKLAKEFEKIRVSLTKSKKIVLADIDKIDEKYRRLAQEEKKSLTESLGAINEQLKFYDKMLGGEQVEEDQLVEEVAEKEVKEDEEPVIQDTIFPENNEEAKEEPVDGKDDRDEGTGLSLEEVEEKMKAVGLTELKEEDTVFDSSITEQPADQYADIWPDENTAEPEKVEEKVEQKVIEDTDWPAFPDSPDWK